MREINTSLTEPQLEALRIIYVYQKVGQEPDAHVAQGLAELGLCGRTPDGSWVRTELGVGFVKSLGWTWGFWEHPHLPSPEGTRVE